jgi:hypothetical protein
MQKEKKEKEHLSLHYKEVKRHSHHTYIYKHYFVAVMPAGKEIKKERKKEEDFSIISRIIFVEEVKKID